MPILNLDLTTTNGLSSNNFVNRTSSILVTGTATLNLINDYNGEIIVLTNNTGVTVTVPANLPLGYSVTIIQAGTGQVTIQPAGGSGVSINSDGGKNKIASQHSSASLICYGSDVFNLAGNLTV